MNIKIVKNFDAAFCTPVNSRLILVGAPDTASPEDSLQFSGISPLKLFVLNPETSEKVEIAPDIKKYFTEDIIYAAYDRDYVVYATSDHGADDNIIITYYIYRINDGISSMLHSIEVDPEKFLKTEFIKVFVLSDSHILIQRKTVGEINNDYELSLFNAESGQTIQITIPFFTQGGISTILPLPGNQCVIKTGEAFSGKNQYSLKPLTHPEEIVGFLPVNQLISELFIDMDNDFLGELERSRENTTIPYVRVHDKRIIYAIYYAGEGKEDVVIYDTETGSRTVRYTSVISSINDLWHTYVVDATPYLITGSDGKRGKIIDLNTQKCILRLERGDDIPFVYEDLAICTRKIKKLFKDIDYVEVYQFPDIYVNPILSIKAVYERSVVNGDDIIIFVKDIKADDDDNASK